MTKMWIAVAVALAMGAMVPASNAAEPLEPVETALKQRLDDARSATGSKRADAQLAEIRAYYQTRNFKPVWSRDTGPKGKAKALVGEIRTSAVHGLKPGFYKIDQISALLNSRTPKDRAELDLLLSGALVDLGHDLANGRVSVDNKAAGKGVKPVALPAAELIEGAADAGNLRQFAANLLTNDKRYMRLVAKLVEFSRIAKSGVWPKIDAEGKPINPGARDRRIADIRQVLVLFGDLPVTQMNGGNRFDAPLQEAITRFQERNGLLQSGAIDAATLARLSWSAEDILRAITINLERRRWQNRPLGERYLFVNLADSEVKIVDKGVTVGVYRLVDAHALSEVPVHFAHARVVETEGAEIAAVTLALKADQTRSTFDGETLLQVSDPERALARFFAEREGNGGEPPLAFITYLTAWADGKGRLSLRADATGRDAAVSGALRLSQ